MRLEFQKSIASSKFLLPIVSVIATIGWFLIPADTPPFAPPCTPWEWLSTEGFGREIGYCVCVITVYLLAELNNAFALLRISSRMLSSTLFASLASIALLHCWQPGHIVMLMTVLSFFSTMRSYQQPIPSATFQTYVCLSVASLVCPPMLLMVPVYWCLLSYLRAMSLRCFSASILGLLLPYWFLFGTFVCLGRTDLLLTIANEIADSIEWEQYAAVTPYRWASLAYVMAMLVIGSVNFNIHAFKDSTRTRITYNMLIIHAIAATAILALCIQYFDALLPLLLLDAAILFGHFASLTYSRLSHIICIIWLIATLSIIVYGIIE